MLEVKGQFNISQSPPAQGNCLTFKGYNPSMEKMCMLCDVLCDNLEHLSYTPRHLIIK